MCFIFLFLIYVLIFVELTTINMVNIFGNEAVRGKKEIVVLLVLGVYLKNEEKKDIQDLLKIHVLGWGIPY